MYAVGRTTASAIGVQLATHATGQRGVRRANIATNIATTAQIPRLLTYAGQRLAPTTSGRPRHNAAVLYGSTMPNTAKGARSQAPVRAIESSGRLYAISSANPSVASCTVRTVASMTPLCDLQY